MRQITGNSIRRTIALFMVLFSLLSYIPGNVFSTELTETQPESTTATEQVTSPTEETTIPAEDATEPTEETTGATEEVTAPTEETVSDAEVLPVEDEPESDEPEIPIYYFDLYAGNVTISGNGTQTTLSGYRYDGQATAQEFTYTVNNTEKYQVHVYQSNHAQSYTQTGWIDGTLTIPSPARVDGWGAYITNNSDVEAVIAKWLGLNRPSAANRIHVSGKVNCDLVLDNLYSTYQIHNTSKETGGVSFVSGGSSTLTLKLKGDNRFGNIFYYGSQNGKNKLIFEDYPGQAVSGTVTVANVKKNSNENYWCAAIGGNDSGKDASDGVTINSGVLFAGTNAKDDCTAIGGGGNGFGGITINGGTVTATVTSSGAAIGGGIGKTSVGGTAKVTITGGTVYAYNFSCKSSYSQKGVKYIPAAAIGGGSSAQQICNPSEITITGGTVYAQSVGGTAIGGGSSADNNGGDSTITITGGMIEAYSIPGKIDGQDVPAGVAIGGGTGYDKGGFAKLTVSSDATLRTGSIGGGSFGNKNNANGIIGRAEVTITGGNTRGQVVMEGTGSFFNMSGGIIDNQKLDNVDYSNCHFVKENGGAACVETGTVDISGTAIIRNASAPDAYGGAIYLSNGTVTMRNGAIENCWAKYGGAVSVSGGNFNISGGTIGGESINNTAENGGAVYVDGGNVTISGGTISYNTAENGGAVYVDGGNVSISGGTISYNEAALNGGGIAVNNGSIIMSGGSVIHNEAQTGSGGGMYVSAPAGKAAAVKVFSGTLSNNTSSVNGGAVAVEGQENSTITVHIGVNKSHYDSNKNLSLGFEHTEEDTQYIHNSCPHIENNLTSGSGGAFFITAPTNSTTYLDIFCITEQNNQATGDIDPVQNNKPLSNFLMVEGGRVFISTAKDYSKYPGENDLVEDPEDSLYGRASIMGSVHVVSGQLELFGSMNNPSFDDALTIDLQKTGDKYVDHRVSPSKVKISYHENFVAPNGEPDSTQTAFDLVSGSQHMIENGLYVHAGYELMGYNTDPDAIYGITQDGWYTPGQTYTFFNPKDINCPDGMQEGDVDHQEAIHCGDLTVYAIWRVNGYTMEFLPGTSNWSGSVDPISCEYDVTYTLPENGFVNAGYIFDHWLYNGVQYYPGQEVMNLTKIHADTIPFVAQWVKCTHPEANCSYTSTSDTLTKTCHLCQLTGTAKLSTQDVVYDGLSHYAVVEVDCKEDGFLDTTVSYSGVKLQYDTESHTCIPTETPVDAPESCVNAGFYTATISGGEETVQATFTIDKAPQTAPTCVPLYKLPDQNHQLTIYQLSDVSQRINATSGVHVAYYLRYTDTETHTVTFPSDGLAADEDIIYSLSKALVEYKVLAGYPETDNYLPSAQIDADSSFLYFGHIYLQVTAEDGVDCYLWEDNGLKLFVNKESDEYVLIGEDFTFKKEITNGSTAYDVQNKLLIEQLVPNESGAYVITAEDPPEEDVHVLITVGGVKKMPKITGEVMEKQFFSSFTPDPDTNIARDSAFTMLYKISGFYTEDYQQPVLQFSPGLPKDATVILRNQEDGSYWYYRAGSTAQSVAFGEFKSMVDKQTKFVAATVDMDLQFIVDFSRVDQNDLIAANALECTLYMESALTPGTGISGAVGLGLHSVSAELTRSANQPENPLEVSLDLDILIGAAASKYDERDLALVLTPHVGTTVRTELPPDAAIVLNQNGNYSTYWCNQRGSYIIPIGAFRSMDTTMLLELSSKLFPTGSADYYFDAALYLSNSNAEAAPLDGTKLSGDVKLRFESERTDTGIKIVTESDQRIFTNKERISVGVETLPRELDNRYIVTVQLHRELDGEYGNTLVSHVNYGNNYVFDLSNLYAGNYCVVATLNDSATGYALEQARYYFILEDATN